MRIIKKGRGWYKGGGNRSNVENFCLRKDEVVLENFLRDINCERNIRIIINACEYSHVNLFIVVEKENIKISIF